MRSRANLAVLDFLPFLDFCADLVLMRFPFNIGTLDTGPADADSVSSTGRIALVGQARD